MDHLAQPLETHANAPNQAKESSLVKGVQELIRNLLNHSDSELDSSSGNWPGFVSLVELQPGGEISCTPEPLKS